MPPRPISRVTRYLPARTVPTGIFDAGAGTAIGCAEGLAWRSPVPSLGELTSADNHTPQEACGSAAIPQSLTWGTLGGALAEESGGEGEEKGSREEVLG